MHTVVVYIIQLPETETGATEEKNESGSEDQSTLLL